MDPSAAEKSATEPTRHKLCLGKLGIGTLGAAMALWAIKIDATNNYQFGVEHAGKEGGQLLVLAALALAIVPMLAVVVPAGWDRLLRIVFWGSVVATIIAAINAYGVKQGAAIDAAKGAHDRYEQALEDRDQARRDLAEARAEVAAIAETVPAAELQKLHDDAKDRRDQEASDPKRGAKCGDICRKAEAEMNAYAPRIAMARAKEIALVRADKAQARLDAAKVEGKDGPKEQTPIAKAVAAWIGTTAEDAAGAIALVMAAVMITISVSAGLIFDHSFQALRKGLGFGHGEDRKAESAPKAAEPKPKLRRMPKAISETGRIDRFIGERIRQGVAGKIITSAQLYELFQAWWMSHSPSMPLPSRRAVALRMKEAGLVSVKRGGTRVYQDMALVTA